MNALAVALLHHYKLSTSSPSPNMPLRGGATFPCGARRTPGRVRGEADPLVSAVTHDRRGWPGSFDSTTATTSTRQEVTIVDICFTYTFF